MVGNRRSFSWSTNIQYTFKMSKVKKFIVNLVLLVITCGVLIAPFTVPDTQDHQNAVKKLAAVVLNVDEESIYYDLAADLLIRHVADMESDSYFFFSIGRIGPYRFTLGMYNKVIFIL